MVRTAALVTLLAALGLTLSGCGPCGWFSGGLGLPDMCRSDPAPPR